MMFGQVIMWTDSGGRRTTVRVYCCESQEEAIMEAIKSALQMGWTYPKFWEFWRRGDTRPLDSAPDLSTKPITLPP
jgi:hypothetical protein